MAVGNLKVGDVAIWLCSYNPRDVVTLLYCQWAVGRALELLADTSVSEVHAWLRQRFPQCGPLLDSVEAGVALPESMRFKPLTVTPGEEVYELPIVTMLNHSRKISSAPSSPSKKGGCGCGGGGMVVPGI